MKKYIVEVDDYGARHWKNEDGQLHREDGPAIECPDGTKFWFLNGQCHRTDGPAIERADGTQEWWLNGKLHRIDGPVGTLSDTMVIEWQSRHS